jgi:hypothetical protein
MTPPREWFEEHFVHDGEVTYCSYCYAIPLAFIGHDCMSMEAHLGGYAADKITVPYRWEDVMPIENDYHPGDWKLAWIGAKE